MGYLEETKTPREKVTIGYILEKKAKGEKLSRTALYDYPMAVLAEEAGIEIINVGDSIANVVFGHVSTVKADLDIMVEHAVAVRKGAPSVFIMGDMPFLSYQASIREAIHNAGRYIREADMDCVKIEGGMEIVPLIEALTKAGIPVIAHTGLTPQSAIMLGGFKAQGRSTEVAYKLIKAVAAFEEAGAIAVVIELVPVEVAKVIYERSSIPILGTGCGPYSDSPMINWYDMLGFYEKNPKFVKKYANLRQTIIDAAACFIEECRTGVYPGEEHGYKMMDGEEEKLQRLLQSS
ncbi:MAG: 3-methyl-2-oxobutanoate hydroxymethyltransferase [Clostridiales bacterium]|jgi:3-methyl-2-oxobutanoate hydroxymethyltransferase|nr:3-methyl-2-oxobutanoate hydroxymethyltransferase [Clostridiales bacterium]